MPHISLKLLTLALAITTIGMASTIGDEETLHKISGYRGWTRVTEKPAAVDISSIAG